MTDHDDTQEDQPMTTTPMTPERALTLALSALTQSRREPEPGVTPHDLEGEKAGAAKVLAAMRAGLEYARAALDNHDLTLTDEEGDEAEDARQLAEALTTFAGPMRTWTFLGHWGEDGEVVVEEVLEGEVEDDRPEDFEHEGGLFAASASGYTIEAAEAKVRREYEED